ncbi:PREDICTED: uncharacterized protein LOC104991322 [Bison bison bison]|uniref:Uncharacterized protein LOC104991322 n=1 Tax=Bison bison bison TaxID=43346 RepID=A0A6P3HIA5_BISBB|nr:PREDICTED: uncharacterized protein LOC104991322 [Bison bison bison]
MPKTHFEMVNLLPSTDRRYCCAHHRQAHLCPEKVLWHSIVPAHLIVHSAYHHLEFYLLVYKPSLPSLTLLCKPAGLLQTFRLKGHRASGWKSRTRCTRSGVRTHEDINPLDLKSNALTTRPFWYLPSRVSRGSGATSKRWGRLKRQDSSQRSGMGPFPTWAKVAGLGLWTLRRLAEYSQPEVTQTTSPPCIIHLTFCRVSRLYIFFENTDKNALLYFCYKIWFFEIIATII